jgi:hypothetical protein
MKNKYYVYLHIKETDGKPFYVGKGCGNRAYQSGKNNRSNYWNNIVNKYGFDIIFLELNLTEQEALEKEIYWIKRIGRKDLNEGPLINFTDGGEGTSGYKFNDKQKINLSVAMAGRTFSHEHKNKMSESHKGKTFSDEHKKKISESLKGKLAYNRRRIIAYNTLDNTIIGIYDSVKIAGEALPISYASVKKILLGDFNKIKNITVKYYEQ